MKMSVCKSYGDLPLFLNAKLVAQVLGVSISTAYEVMHEPGFPTLRVGSRMVVPPISTDFSFKYIFNNSGEGDPWHIKSTVYKLS